MLTCMKLSWLCNECENILSHNHKKVDISLDISFITYETIYLRPTHIMRGMTYKIIS